VSTGGSKRLVLNSHRFFRDVLPEVLNELPPEEIDVLPPQGDPTLYATIRDGRHRIILTPGILKQYEDEAPSEGFTQRHLLSVIQQLEFNQLVIRPRLRGGARNFPHVPNYHRAFLYDAIDAKADYFLTERDVWLSRRDIIAREYPDLTIITPAAFIQRQSI